MIFRTITDDITGANKSIGLFGKSLENVKNVLYSFQTNGIKNTLFNTPLSNIDTKAIDSYNNAIRSSVPFEKALAIARRTTNAETVALIESTNGEEVQLESLTAVQKASTLAAKAHSAALKAVSIAGNMILFTAIAKGIQLATKAFDDYVHRVDRARERTEELFSEFKQMNDTLADHKKTVAELADRYDELSKHVNTIDNSNISLSDEDYDEFLDINQQLVDIFPELYDGLGENGSAILNIGTSAQSASEYLQELINKEEYLNNIKIASNLDELFKNVSVQVEDSNSKISQLEEELNSLDTTYKNAELMNAGDILGLDMLEIGDNPELINAVSRSIQQLQDEVYAQFKDNKLDTEEYLNFVDNFVNPALYNGATIFDGYVNLIALDDAQKQRLQNIIQEQTESLMNELNDSVSAATGKIALEKQNNDAIWVDFIPNLIASMKSKANFQKLEDVGLGDFAVLLVEQLDASIMEELRGTAYENDIYGYVRDKILVPIQDAIKDESGNINVDDLEKIKNQISDALNMKDSFNKNDSSVADYVGQVNDLISSLESLGMSPDIIKYVKVIFDYDEAEKLRNRLSNGGQDLVVDDWIDTLTQEEVKLANSTAFDEALERHKKGLDGAALSAENYNAALDEVKASQDGIGDETGNSILSSSDFLNKFETQYKPALSAIQSSINQVMEATENGIKLKVDSESAINAISDIRNAVDEINNSEEIDFNIDTRSVDEFSDKLMNALDSGDLNAVKQAYTDFANDVVNSMQDMFGDINESNMQAAQKALESVGVLNAEQIIAEKTGYSYAEYSAAKEAAANAGVNLNGTVEQVVAQLDAEGLAATDDAKAIMEYMIKKAAASGMGIDVSGAIAALGEEWEWLQALIEQWGRYNSVSQKGHGNTSGTKNLGSGMYNPVVPEKVETDVEVDLKWPNLDSSARGAGSKAGKSFKDGLKKELSDLDSVISGITGRIDDQISSINEQKSVALESIDAQKEALEEAKDAAIEALEAERDAQLAIIEEQKKALEKKIKAKQDEIDAINDAIETRQRELDLQKAQYELERMQNQRTKLIYSESKGMHYVQDTQGIASAKEKVDEAKREIEIANLEKEKKLLEDQLELLDERAEKINEFYDEQIKQTEKYYDGLLKNLDKQRKETESYFESLIKNLENSKSKYQELTEILEKAELSAKLKQLGIDEEALLNGSEEEFNKLKDAYMNIVFELNKGNDDVLEALRKLSGYDGTAPAVLEESNDKLGTMNDELGDANTNVGTVNSSLTKTASTTSTVATNVGTVVDGLNQLPENSKISGLAGEFETLATKIGEVAKAIGIGEGEATSTLLQAMSNLNTVTLGNEGEGIIGQFTLLKNAIADVIETIGSTEAQTVGSLMSAISQLNSISLDENIITQFTNLKTAIDQVTAAISGGGGESSEGTSSGSTSGSTSGKQGSSGGKGGKGSEGESGGGNSLTGAIESMGETAKEVIGEPDAEGDGTVIGEFGSMETAVNDVRDAIGTEGGEGQGGDSGGETDDTLVGSIVNLGDTTQEEMGESDGEGILGKFNEFKGVIEEAANQVKSISEGLDEIDGKEVECTITVNVKMNGSIPAFASGTVLGNMQIESAAYNAKYGKAFASGTIGLPKAEKNALVSEYGQTEMTVLPDGKTIITDTPTLMDLPKDTVIYNEEETKKIMDNKVDVSGNAHDDGTDDTIWTTLADGTRVRDLQPGDRMYDMMQKFDAYFNSMDGNIEKLVPNSVYEHQRQMEDMAKQINYVSSVVNNNRNVQQPVISGGINITCPGVTSKEVAQQVGVELNNMFNGLHLEAMQQSMMKK